MDKEIFCMAQIDSQSKEQNPFSIDFKWGEIIE